MMARIEKKAEPKVDLIPPLKIEEIEKSLLDTSK